MIPNMSGDGTTNDNNSIQSQSSASTSIGIVHLPPPEVCLELLGLYFEYIHDQFHSLFHRPSMEDDLAKGRMPKVILFSIIALAARLVVSDISCKTLLPW